MSAEPTAEQAPEHPVDPLDEARMSIIEHLAELRIRLIYSIIGIFIGIAVCWIWVDQLFVYLLLPLKEAVPDGHLNLAQIHHKDLAEPFFAMLKIAVVGGIFASSPVSLYNLWKFIAPGLYSREKKIAAPFVVMATLFFFGGAAFCFYLVLPFGYRYLINFGLGVTSSPELMLSEYLSLTTKMLLVFGAVFELPIVTAFLAGMGVVDHHSLLKHWRAAIIVAFIVGAVLTPPDPMTQCLLAVPLCLLYGISVGVAFFFSKRKQERDEEMMKELEEL